MKQKFSTFFFVRSYVAIVLAIVMLALLLDSLLATRAEDNTEAELTTMYSPMFSMLAGSAKGLEPSMIASRIADTTADWNIPVSVLPLDEFAGLQTVTDKSGVQDVHLFYNSNSEPMLYQLLPHAALVLALGPLPVHQQETLFETVVISAYYGLVALLVFLWIRPFYRDLSLLRSAAAEFGKQDFSTRVELSSKSSILPVAQSFNAMAARIEYLVSAHRELTNAVSHELRTPLARFKFSLEILTRINDAAKQQDYLNNMKIDVAELETLIDEMLTYARLTEQNLLVNLVDIDLRTWLQQELAVYANLDTLVTCSFANQPSAGDFRTAFNPELMARAIHNIIRNGLRYAFSTINVHVNLNTDKVCIRICDDGPGIPAEMHEKIFEPFSRLETSRDKNIGGYGLGLAIAARILQRHQGTIKVSNCEPKGVCFVMNWPRNRLAASS
ncbi:MAG: ATP-binding protein [Pseudomonadota bacterium]